MKLSILFLLLSVTAISFADDVYFRNNYVYRNCFVVDTTDNRIRVKMTSGPDRVFPLTSIDRIDKIHYDPTKDTYISNVTEDEAKAREVERAAEIQEYLNPGPPDENPDGKIGTPVILFGGGFSIDAYEEGFQGEQDDAQASADYSGFWFKAGFELPASKSVTWGLAVDYARLTSKTFAPANSETVFSSSRGHRLSANLLFKIYP